MAEVILVVAIGKDDVKSAPIKIYLTGDVKLPKQFVLRMDDAPENDNGVAQVKLSNFALKLIVSNSKEFLEDKLTGFRRVQGDDTFVLCERMKDDIPTAKSVAGIALS